LELIPSSVFFAVCLYKLHSVVFTLVFFIVCDLSEEGFHPLEVAASLLLALACDVYHAQPKLF